MFRQMQLLCLRRALFVARRNNALCKQTQVDATQRSANQSRKRFINCNYFDNKIKTQTNLQLSNDCCNFRLHSSLALFLCSLRNSRQGAKQQGTQQQSTKQQSKKKEFSLLLVGLLLLLLFGVAVASRNLQRLNLLLSWPFYVRAQLRHKDAALRAGKTASVSKSAQF